VLDELLEDDDNFGFIAIMDGNGCLYATLQGNIHTPAPSILLKFTVDLTCSRSQQYSFPQCYSP
jgi:hypothetical protein